MSKKVVEFLRNENFRLMHENEHLIGMLKDIIESLEALRERDAEDELLFHRLELLFAEGRLKIKELEEKKLADRKR